MGRGAPGCAAPPPSASRRPPGGRLAGPCRLRGVGAAAGSAAWLKRPGDPPVARQAAAAALPSGSLRSALPLSCRRLRHLPPAAAPSAGCPPRANPRRAVEMGQPGRPPAAPLRSLLIPRPRSWSNSWGDPGVGPAAVSGSGVLPVGLLSLPRPAARQTEHPWPDPAAWRCLSPDHPGNPKHTFSNHYSWFDSRCLF